MSADSAGSDVDVDDGGVIDIANSRAADGETKQIVKTALASHPSASKNQKNQKKQPDGCRLQIQTQTWLEPQATSLPRGRETLKVNSSQSTDLQLDSSFLILILHGLILVLVLALVLILFHVLASLSWQLMRCRRKLHLSLMFAPVHVLKEHHKKYLIVHHSI
ncbi:hypothetical protein ACLKA7_016284 [Drosophila subpalustris]